MTLAMGTVVAGRWKVVGDVGKGGLGEVYLVKHEFTGKRGALKVLRAAGKEAVVLADKMHAEAQLLSRTKHPNLVEVYDAGKNDDGSVWMVMELLEGRDLARVLEEDGALPPDRTLRYTESIASAVAVVHDAGVIHRDLKPENIFVTHKDVVKVIDFGTARYRQAATMEGQIVGTIPYMSPEHLRGGDLDGRTDVWALGVIMHEMLFGRHPFRVADTETGWPPNGELIGMIFSQDLPSALNFGDVARIIKRATARDRDRRLRTMSQFAAELHRLRAPTLQPLLPTARLSEHDLVGAQSGTATVPLQPIAHASTASAMVRPAADQGSLTAPSKGLIAAVFVAIALLTALTVVLLLPSETPSSPSTQPSSVSDEPGAGDEPERATSGTATAQPDSPMPTEPPSPSVTAPSSSAAPEVVPKSPSQNLPVLPRPRVPQPKKKGGLDW